VTWLVLDMAYDLDAAVALGRRRLLLDAASDLDAAIARGTLGGGEVAGSS
jgi:hypothetical protein